MIKTIFSLLMVFYLANMPVFAVSEAPLGTYSMYGTIEKIENQYFFIPNKKTDDELRIRLPYLSSKTKQFENIMIYADISIKRKCHSKCRGQIEKINRVVMNLKSVVPFKRNKTFPFKAK